MDSYVKLKRQFCKWLRLNGFYLLQTETCLTHLNFKPKWHFELMWNVYLIFTMASSADSLTGWSCFDFFASKLMFFRSFWMFSRSLSLAAGSIILAMNNGTQIKNYFKCVSKLITRSSLLYKFVIKDQFELHIRILQKKKEYIALLIANVKFDSIALVTAWPNPCK